MTGLQALHDASHTMVMGVLNITEDSLSDGGLWLDPAKAAQHGRDMMAAGATSSTSAPNPRVPVPSECLRRMNWPASPVPSTR